MSSVFNRKREYMRTRRWSIAAATVGVLLVVAAFVISFMVTPALDKLPADTDRTATMSGTMQTPNPSDSSAMVSQSIELERTVKVDKVVGDDALVGMTTRTFTVPRGEGEKPLSETALRFGIDRKTYGQASPPGGAEVTDQKGASVFAFAPHPSHDDATLYDSTLAKAVSLKFSGTKEISGRKMLTFKTANAGRVGDEAMAARLRAALGKKFGTDGTSVPAAVLEKQGMPAAALKSFGQSVPVSLVVASDATIDVDAERGNFVSLEQNMTVSAAIGDPSRPLVRTPVQILNLTSTEATVADGIAAIEDGESKLSLVRLWIPLALGLLGLILVAVGALLWRRGGAVGAGSGDRGPASAGASESAAERVGSLSD
ncbi:DUF3068 domain-containing protein [Gordonia amarae]|uniref:DUF3068 domain-containing protein n=1 Tax=Gordonia amarae TaxID=36821 RepID=A0A857MHC4_9ACTN|nr:DUF3068 domain-containing protein [Gordonia amarae]QHN24281.1 DUF3068 domain-containing protein [Gordonia amarae]QHN33200.1 DUF3068 domain-containing protein [Gordonia amarae]QHN41923.1 DUF3068 domain-containing protein [Gordonia amarae]